MRNIYDISKLSDSDFLNFLYLERSRHNDKKTSAGWTLWAIWGSILALAIFLYQTLKVNKLDYVLCYYILASFSPCVVLVVYLSERIRLFSYGDSKHIVRLKDAAPKLFLFYISLINLLLLAIGFYLHVSIMSFLGWSCIFIPIIISWSIIYLQRNRLVTSFDNFVIARNKWVNRVLIFGVSGTILLPIGESAKHLTWGFSGEFECVFSLILIVALSYLLLLSYFARNYVHEIDNLIDGFVFKNWPKEIIMRKLELIFLGFRPNDIIQDQLSEMLCFWDDFPNMQKKIGDIEGLSEVEMSVEQISDSLRVIGECLEAIDKFLDCYKRLLGVINELLRLKTTLLDDEFVSTLNNLQKSPTIIQSFQKCVKQVQGKLKEKILNKEQEICADS